MAKPTRRDFLKLASLLPVNIAFEKFQFAAGDPNVFILVLDALAAPNMSLYGYQRNTTPNISRFAERSSVYHAHHSAGTFTTPGTASLLTGMYPWKHRALGLSGIVRRELAENNIFKLLRNGYNTVGFTQNYLADFLLSQFEDWIDFHIPLGTFGESAQGGINAGQKDQLIRKRAFDQFLFGNVQTPASLLFGAIHRYENLIRSGGVDNRSSGIKSTYLEGDSSFILEKVFDQLAGEIQKFHSPFFAYVHLLPPHGDYIPGPEFVQAFMDDWHPRHKRRHPVLSNWETNPVLESFRRLYDQYLARTDAAFGRFIEMLDGMGVLENSYFILTSDHGEMFERGVTGHLSPLVYEPGIKVPLLIHAPGQSTRLDYRAPTSSIDIVPTLMALLGHGIPSWCEGKVLPGFGGREDYQRVTFSMIKKSVSSPKEKLSPITIAMQQGSYKLIYYVGYKDYKTFADDKRFFTGTTELYDLENDPDELHDLTEQQPDVAKSMLAELLMRYDQEAGPLN